MAKQIMLVVALFAVALGASLFTGQASEEIGRRSGSCDAPVRDPLDSASLQHALPGGPPPSYATEPPTSGPHQAGSLAGGVLSEPLSGPVQVGALEAGQVLLQHRGLASREQAELESLAGPLVIVAPNPALPAPVVASAWLNRQACRSVDAAALQRFIGDHAGRAH